jgi:hypothetical protein
LTLSKTLPIYAFTIVALLILRRYDGILAFRLDSSTDARRKQEENGDLRKNISHIFEIICVYSPDNREYYAIFGADALLAGAGCLRERNHAKCIFTIRLNGPENAAQLAYNGSITEKTGLRNGLCA